MNYHLARFLSSKKALNLIKHWPAYSKQYLRYQSYSFSTVAAGGGKARFLLPKLMDSFPSKILCRQCSSQNSNGSSKLKTDAGVKANESSETVEPSNLKSFEGQGNIPGSMASRFKPFEDRQRIIQDVIDQEWDPQYEEEVETPKIMYKRGKSGVFDLGEMCDLLIEERATDLCVIQIPKEMDYADHMVIVTARSPKHMFALATFIRKRFKSKELKSTDRIPRIEGTVKSEDWIALDLGNIILHLFIEETRELMSLEILWTVGSQYDDLTHQKDTEIVQLLNMFQ